MDVLKIVCGALCVAGYAIAIYYKVKGNVFELAIELVSVAEDTVLSGEKKMAFVVDALYEKVPLVLKKILTKPRLESIAQYTFDCMKKYAENCDLEESVPDAGSEVVADITSQFMSASLRELRIIAEERGVNTEGLKTKKEYARAIIAALLDKA